MSAGSSTFTHTSFTHLLILALLILTYSY